MRNASDTLMSADEVADAFYVPRSTVTRWARDKKLPAFRTPGGHWRFLRRDVEQFVADERGEAVAS